jgi:hypothetical protein
LHIVETRPRQTKSKAEVITVEEGNHDSGQSGKKEIKALRISLTLFHF